MSAPSEELSLEELAALLLGPMTPKAFRVKLDQPQLAYLGLLYDNLLKQSTRRMRPLQAEVDAMKKVRKWWAENLDQETLEMMERTYYGSLGKFIINLSRNYPYGNNGPTEILKNGLPRWDLEPMLKMVFSEETTEIITKEIDRLAKERNGLGGSGQIYEVEFTKQDPNGDKKGIIVRVLENPTSQSL